MMTNYEAVREAYEQLFYYGAYTAGEQWAVDMINGLKRVLEQMRADKGTELAALLKRAGLVPDTFCPTCWHHVKKLMLALGYNSRLDITVQDMTRLIIDAEVLPSVCEDSGQAEWSQGEAEKLAEYIVAHLEEI